MDSFQLKTDIRFGENPMESLRFLDGKRVFIVTDAFMEQSGMTKKITDLLPASQCEIFSDVTPDPSLDMVVKGVESITAFEPQAVVALGGGSAMDCAKAMIYFGRKLNLLQEVKFVVIPTTSGTGSEVTSFSVITHQDTGVKYPLVSPELLPDIAILEPSFLMSLPLTVVADTGMDVITHAIEAYVSTKANPFTDAMAEKACTLAFLNLPISHSANLNKEVGEARIAMHFASCLAGIAFNDASLGINHSMAHILGGRFGIPHGRSNAIILPHVIEFNAMLGDYQRRVGITAAEKYARLAGHIGCGGGTVQMSVKNLISAIKKLQHGLNMPARISQCDVKLADYKAVVGELADRALLDICTATNPRKATKADLIKLFNGII